LYKLFPYVSKLYPKFIKQELNFDMVFPSPISDDYKNTVCWIPDFQDKRLPDFFSISELDARTAQHREYASKAKSIIFSSKSVLADFNHFYPEYNISKNVVRFAVFNDIDNLPSFADIKKKYSLPYAYFYCPNQFWVHKNHAVVIKALSELVGKHKNICLVFSGKEHDHRAPKYLEDLKKLTEDLKLSNNVMFLGFLPRNDQLAIMKNARLVIQPSLFEGWSTVIEDAKSMSQYVLASDIDTHQEQLLENGELFPANDYQVLSGLMEKYVSVEPPRLKLDYTVNQRQFAKDFIKVIDNI
ncbi:MAG: glycosyltransferase, partial [Gammaproteobacteria bacterium]|nr:glycosyltransferase [Gammaproteobacteria bacterium]